MAAAFGPALGLLMIATSPAPILRRATKSIKEQAELVGFDPGLRIRLSLAAER
jgi:hypothetical protein